MFEGKWADYKSSEQFDFVYLDDEEELPYVTLETYASLINNDLKGGFRAYVDEKGNSSTIEVRQNNQTKYLSVKFDRDNKKVTRSPGSLENAMRPVNKLKSTVNEYIQMEEKEISNPRLDFVYSWENTGFKTFTYNEKNYFPFALLDLQISKETNRSFWFLGGDKVIYEVCDVAQYKDLSLILVDEEGKNIYRNVVDLARQNYEKKYSKTSTEQGLQVKIIELPAYLAKYNRDSFYYVMDNFYGLGETLGYKSMATFISNTAYSDQMLNSDGRVRAKAYSNICSILNDGHTGFTGSSAIDEATAMGMSYDQTLLNDRMALQRMLKERRDEELKKDGKDETEVRYSTDGKVAYFSFDEFAAVNYKEEDGKPSDVNTKDTYLYFLKNLKEIKAKGGVEKVVIDDTMNGGGYVGQLCKLLALLSKDNSSKIYYRHRENNTIGCITSKVDTNLDGKIDEQDVTFGNDFKFYILVTSFSFSCGNAFPSYAYDLGLASIIGSKSGGGECVVGGNQLPLGSMVGYSSNIHLGFYDEKEKAFYGYESGCSLNKAFSGNYYNVDVIANLIK